MTTRIAIFVEGQTELLFVEQFCLELADGHHISIARQQIFADRIITLASPYHAPGDPAIEVTIYDCTSDDTVLSAIRSRRAGLEENGYASIVGLRDLYNPQNAVTLEELTELIASALPDGASDTEIVIAVMEVEAWFLADPSVLTKLDKALTAQRIAQEFGIDLEHDDLEAIPHPSVLFDKILKLIGMRYDKHKSTTYAIVKRLDFAVLYADASERVVSLGKFVSCLNRFFENAIQDGNP